MDLSWKKDVERTLRMLEQRTADLPTRLRGGGSGGGAGESEDTSGRLIVPIVETLPAVPTAAARMQLVYWTSDGAGTGDDGIWYTYTGMTRWYPLGHYTTLDGTPGAEELS
jgi:hypothetical protein